VKNITIFDKSGSFSEYSERTERLVEILLGFGLTENEAKIFIFLGKYGEKTAPEITKSIGTPRSETYRLLNNLQERHLVNATLEQPMTYSAIIPKNVIKELVNEEKTKLKKLEEEGKEFQKIWEQIPEFKIEKKSQKEYKFQILHGESQTNNKILELIKKSKKEVLIVGSQKDFIRFYHSDILEQIKKSKTDVKILGSDISKIRDLFKKIKKDSVKSISEEIRKKQCFVLTDRSEAIFFMKDTSKKALVATWTDSELMLNSLGLLFDMMWVNKKDIEEKKEVKELEVDAEFKLRELKQEMMILDEINEYLRNQKR